MQKNERPRVRARQQVFVFHLHRFTGMAFFVHIQGVVGEGFAKKASPFVHRRRPFEGMHTHRANGRRKTGTRK